eukprot:scaffold90175_cov37-Tisochrysis_lutea.AAC.3
MAGLQLSVAAHVAEILPGGSVADSFVKYFNYEGGLEVRCPYPASLGHPPSLCKALRHQVARETTALCRAPDDEH